jgi:putative Ca2+/H+ antiporter (TMEM165/GDT1 family)
VDALILSFAVIFLAELGDKSQLIAMTFATRFKFWTVLAGITFIGFGLRTLRGDQLSAEEEGTAARTQRSVFFAVAIAFFLAELGDKTMLATVTRATTNGWFGTWVGSTIGMVAADALAIGVGALLGTKLPEKVIRIGAATLFFLFGAWLFFEAVTA